MSPNPSLITAPRGAAGRQALPRDALSTVSIPEPGILPCANPHPNSLKPPCQGKRHRPERWHTESGTSSTKAWASQPKRPGRLEAAHGKSSTKAQLSRPKIFSRLGAAHCPRKLGCQGLKYRTDWERHVFTQSDSVTDQEPRQVDGTSSTKDRASRVTAQEPWQTKGGTSSTHAPASRPKRPGRLRAAHLPHKRGVTAQEPWQTGSGTSSTVHTSPGVTAQEAWQTKSSTSSTHARRHGPRAVADWERHIFHTSPASRPKSPGRVGAAHLPHKPGVTGQEPWQTGSVASSMQAPASRPKRPVPAKLSRPETLTAAAHVPPKFGRHGSRVLADLERRILHESLGVTA